MGGHGHNHCSKYHMATFKIVHERQIFHHKLIINYYNILSVKVNNVIWL